MTPHRSLIIFFSANLWNGASIQGSIYPSVFSTASQLPHFVGKGAKPIFLWKSKSSPIGTTGKLKSSYGRMFASGSKKRKAAVQLLTEWLQQSNEATPLFFITLGNQPSPLQDPQVNTRKL